MFTNLKNAIRDEIKRNGQQLITGEMLQLHLLAIVDTVGKNATFAGVAVPGTIPKLEDGPAFYLAGQNGTYRNLGGVEVLHGLYVFTNISGVWSAEKILDTTDLVDTATDAAEAALAAFAATDAAIVATRRAHASADVADAKAALANTATGEANAARDAANAAAQNADAKASLANTATGEANTARDAANAAALYADAKASLANTATGEANTARDAANTAAQNADAKAALANTATGEANTARDAANAAAQNADAKAALANTATGEANTARDAANAAALYAQEQGDFAKEQALGIPSMVADKSGIPEEKVSAQSLSSLNARIKALETQVAKTVREKLEIEGEFNLWGKTNMILSGSGAPAFAPDFIGQRYLDVASKVAYSAFGVNNAGDWK